nr:PREDICTED: uncharacterized protein LOC108196340 isoform X2 [Daucus carota subsp. sativus]
MTTLSTDAEFQIPVHTHLSDNGIREKVIIPASKPYISLIGNQNAAYQTVITWGDKASDIVKDGTVLGTYRLQISFCHCSIRLPLCGWDHFRDFKCGVMTCIL